MGIALTLAVSDQNHTTYLTEHRHAVLERLHAIENRIRQCEEYHHRDRVQRSQKITPSEYENAF